MARRTPFIRCDGVSKAFGPLTVIDRLQLDIFQGEFISLLGPSGSGKTTLLTLIAGFETPTEGGIWLDGHRIDQLPPHKRDMGVVFQNYALFPHMTVAENVSFPLRMRGLRKALIAEKVGRVLDMVQLQPLKDRRPAQLSGGQQQRVALARALVFEPQVVLMDEPLGALDKRLREQMQFDIRALHRRLELTVIFVTHDQSEALTMSDRIAVFNKGRIEQIGRPSQIYDRPATRFIAEFIGEANLLTGTVVETDDKGSLVRLSGERSIRVAARLEAGRSVEISLRPERIEIGGGVGGWNVLRSTILDCVYMGDHLRLQLDDGAFGLIVRAPRRRDHWQAGMTLDVAFSPEDCWAIPQ